MARTMHQFLEFVINHWTLWAALLVVLLLVINNELSGAVGGVAMLNPQQVTDLINHQNAVVLDIRPEDDFSTGHITGALHYPADKLETEQEKLEKKYKSKPLVIICQNGNDSAKLAGQLLKQSSKQVFALKGGISGWVDASLPLVK